MPGWSPPALEGHSAHVVQGKMYLFGGQSTNGPTNDLAVLDLARLRWSRATLVGPLRPAPRCFHAGWSDDSRRVRVHGGEGVAGADDDEPSARPVAPDDDASTRSDEEEASAPRRARRRRRRERRRRPARVRDQRRRRQRGRAALDARAARHAGRPVGRDVRLVGAGQPERRGATGRRVKRARALFVALETPRARGAAGGDRSRGGARVFGPTCTSSTSHPRRVPPAAVRCTLALARKAHGDGRRALREERPSRRRRDHQRRRRRAPADFASVTIALAELAKGGADGEPAARRRVVDGRAGGASGEVGRWSRRRARDAAATATARRVGARRVAVFGGMAAASRSTISRSSSAEHARAGRRDRGAGPTAATVSRRRRDATPRARRGARARCRTRSAARAAGGAAAAAKKAEKLATSARGRARGADADAARGRPSGAAGGGASVPSGGRARARATRAASARRCSSAATAAATATTVLRRRGWRARCSCTAAWSSCPTRPPRTSRAKEERRARAARRAAEAAAAKGARCRPRPTRPAPTASSTRTRGSSSSTTRTSTRASRARRARAARPRGVLRSARIYFMRSSERHARRPLVALCFSFFSARRYAPSSVLYSFATGEWLRIENGPTYPSARHSHSLCVLQLTLDGVRDEAEAPLSFQVRAAAHARRRRRRRRARRAARDRRERRDDRAPDARGVGRRAHAAHRRAERRARGGARARTVDDLRAAKAATDAAARSGTRSRSAGWRRGSARRRSGR